MESNQDESEVGAEEEHNLNNGNTEMEQEITDTDWVKMDYDCLSDQAQSCDDDSDSSPEPEIHWRKEIPQKTEIPFIGSSGLSVPTPKDLKEFFKLLLDDQLFETIARQTNKNAEEIRLRGKDSDQRALSGWTELSGKETQVFFGLALLLGNDQLEKWDMDDWMVPRIVTLAKRKMEKGRFDTILHALCYADPTDAGNKIDSLFQIRPLLDYFSQKMQSIYYPSRELVADEPAAFRRGVLQLPQGRKNEKHTCAMRLYSLGESNGLVMKFLMTPRYDDEDVSISKWVKKIVNRLLEGYKNKGHSVYLDDIYNTVPLFQELLRDKTFCTGYLRNDRKGSPKELRRKKLTKDSCEQLFTDEGVCVVKWRGAMMMSSEHDATLVQTKHGKTSQVFAKFEQDFGDDEERHDMYRLFTGFYEGKLFKWHIITGLHIIHALVINACVLYNKYSGKKLSQYSFRCRVAEHLVGLPPSPEVENKDDVSDEGDYEESSSDDFFNSCDESDTDEDM